MKVFNIAGPVDPEKHYYLAHNDVNTQLTKYIEQKKCFNLNAPPQTGKTSVIQEYAKKLNFSGNYQALYVDFKRCEIKDSNNILKNIFKILWQFQIAIIHQLRECDKICYFLKKLLSKDISSPLSFTEFIQYWCDSSTKPVILFIDNLDSISGDTFIHIAQQLTYGFLSVQNSPQSIGLASTHNIKKYNIWSHQNQRIIPVHTIFTLEMPTLELQNFTKHQIKNFFAQHAHATGQVVTDDALDYIFHLTQGHPWLVNLLGYYACFKLATTRNQPITKKVIEQAQHTIMYEQDIKNDLILERFGEPIARSIIHAIITGTAFDNDQITHTVLDIESLKKTGMDIASLIYQELAQNHPTESQKAIASFDWYQDCSGALNTPKLLSTFQQFYRNNAEYWKSKFKSKKSAPFLLFKAFLETIIGKNISFQHKQFVASKHSAFMIIPWKFQRIAINLTLALSDNTQEMEYYMKTHHATEGHIIHFDQDSDRSYNDKKQHHKNIFIAKNQIILWDI
jgi:hypothetical protein